ncbi:MAG TPA: protein-L-isoaspartate(D-aspartate) O-methyltransferase [Bauldia sp.]|nr:protein-L-isoaspartate(D-aspartate) O-methyltransferase [Bauldia sp.]
MPERTPIATDDARRVRIEELILRLRKAGITDRRIVGAIEAVPRDVFVPAEARADAYAERALPIDCGQTISAPVVVGLMTAALDAGPRDRVLEVGTGTGYQTAVLAGLCRRVYTIERFRTLTEAAESRLKTLRIDNVTTLVGDGTKGWPEQAPFDRIIVTAAAEKAPPALLAQLGDGGVMVAPVGPQDGVQRLVRIERPGDTPTTTELAGSGRFVPPIPGKAARL